MPQGQVGTHRPLAAETLEALSSWMSGAVSAKKRAALLHNNRGNGP